MKKNKSVLTACIVIICIAAASVFLTPLIKNGAVGSAVRKRMTNDLNNVDGINIVSRCVPIGDAENSVAGVKEAVRLGADGVIADLCFNSDNIPVLSSDYSERANAPAVEELFKTLQEKKYSSVTLYLNIVQGSDMSELNRLAVKYNMLDRLVLIGIDRDRYGLITGDDTIVPFLLDYELTNDDLNAINGGAFSAPECLAAYGASGLVLDSESVTQKVIEAFNGLGIPLLISKAKNEVEFCDLLLCGAESVVADNTEKCRKILDEWISVMQKRYESSVEKSLSELSKKAAS